jgi:hypothetical protein
MAQLDRTAYSPLTGARARLAAAPHLRRLALPLALALLAILAVFLGYQRPTVVSLPADDYHTRLFAGFNKLEQNEARIFRWTNGDATICVPQTGHASTAFVHLQMLGSAPLRQGIDSVTVSLGDGPPARVPLRDGDHWYRLLLRPGAADGSSSCLRMQSGTFLEGSNPRRLGVPFGALRLELWTPGGFVLPPLDLALAVGLLAALSYILLRRLTSNAPLSASAVALLTLGLLAGVYLRLVDVTFDTARMLAIPLGAAVFGVGALAAWAGAKRWALPRLPLPARAPALELLAVALAVVALLGGRELAQYLTGHHGFYPLKAGIWPNPNWLLVWPALLYVAFLALMVKALRTPESALPMRVLLPTLVFFAAVMPVALRVAARGWVSLNYTYSLNPSEYIHDVVRIGSDPRGFLGQYVELSPYLRLHNRNHPPGSVLLHWLIARLIAPGPTPATAITVLIAASAVLPIYWLAAGIGGRRLGLLAAAIYAVMPGHLIYTTTSMDAVHNTILAWAIWAFWAAVQPPGKGIDGRAATALLAGLLLALGLFFNFTTLTLGIFGIAVLGNLLLRNTAPPKLHVIRQAALIAFGLLGFYAALYLWSGFDIVASILAGTRNNFDEVQQDLPPSGLATYLFYILVNLVPYMWYLSFWGLPISMRVGVSSLQRWGQAQGMTLLAGAWLIQLLGLALSGLFTREVERIWGFSYPLVAVIVAGYLLAPRRSVWWAAVGLTQFFLLSMFFRTWLNTYW